MELLYHDWELFADSLEFVGNNRSYIAEFTISFN